VYWEAAKAGAFGDEWWHENLRMSKATFGILCDELRPHISKTVTKYRLPVAVDMQVAVTIWRLATNIEYRTIAELFGLGISTVCTIVCRTTSAITHHLLPVNVQMPSESRLREIIQEFETLWGFPQVAGAIDGTHVPILKPNECPSDYYNRKGFYSILMQAVVDSQDRFIDVNIGWPGKVHDARVLANSTFYNKASSGTLLPNWTRTINGVNVPLLILGDPAYPLKPWMMKPYPDTGHLTAAERHFNYRQSRARMVVENAFGRLKGLWHCLLKRMDYYDIEHTTNAVASCVVLHNICEQLGDVCRPDWIHSTDASDSSTLLLPPTAAATADGNANNIRRALSQYVYEHQ